MGSFYGHENEPISNEQGLNDSLSMNHNTWLMNHES